MRTGLIAKKVGMSSYFTESGILIPVTLLKIEDCQVIEHKTKTKNGYNALVLGYGDGANKINKPQVSHYTKLGHDKPKRHLMEFRISEDAFVEVGKELLVNHFIQGQFVDVSGVSIGKGFAGVMKRWNFAGLRASHGVSVSHRSHGSTGQRQDPGRVFKGKKMAGHMGARSVTKQNLQVVLVDKDLGIIAVKGAVPGASNSYVVLKDAIKKSFSENAPYPALTN